MIERKETDKSIAALIKGDVRDKKPLKTLFSVFTREISLS